MHTDVGSFWGESFIPSFGSDYCRKRRSSIGYVDTSGMQPMRCLQVMSKILATSKKGHPKIGMENTEHELLLSWPAPNKGLLKSG